MKNKLILCLWLLCLATTTTVYAQQVTSSSYSIKGMLLDSLTQEGEPYATIRIVKKEMPSKALKMAVTDMKGCFKEKLDATPGLYLLTISSIGKTTVERTFTLNPKELKVDLGTLYTTDATNELTGVEVIAQKPLVKADIDKIAYNVQDDPDSKSNTVLEMLRKVPLVTVDGEDNIKVNGSSNFKIHINGKPDNMMSNNPVDVLKSMPANIIKQIEVITNPGAKYDAEGIGGILNIVTIGSGFEGYTATFSGNASNTGGGGSAYATIKKGKLTLSGRYSFNLNASPRSYSDSSQENLETGDEIVAESSNESDYGFQHGNLEGSYEIDTLQLLSLGFGMYGGNNDGTSEGYTVMNRGLDSSVADPLYSYRTNGDNSGSWYSIRGNIDYQRTSSKNKMRMFTLSYKLNTRPSNSDSKFKYSDKSAVPEWDDYVAAVLLDQRSEGGQNSAEHTFQADYTTPIAKIHTLETGVKYIIRNNTSDNNRYNGEGEYDVDRSSHYKHLSDIMAAYMGYGIKVNKFSAKAGVRYERTMQDVKYADTPKRNFDVNYNDLVPSGSFGFKLTDMSNIRAGYNMRIYRPSIWYLNPYLDDTNPSYIRQGNPNLESEKSHAFNISYSNFTQKFNLNVSLRYSFNNNGIENVTSLINDKEIDGLQNPTEKEVLYATYQNIGKSSSAGLNAYVNWNASPKTRVYLNMNADYAHLKSPAQNLENRGWNFFAYGGVQQTLPLDIRLSLNLMGQTPHTTLQGSGSGFYNYSLSANKSFLEKKRLTLSIFASNFFQKYQTHNRITEGTGFTSSMNSKYSRRRFGISLSYRIGELKASVKKATRSINNDDVKGGGGNSGGEG